MNNELINKLIDDFADRGNDLYSMSMGPNGPIIKVCDDIDDDITLYLDNIREAMLEEIYKEQYISQAVEVACQKRFIDNER